MNDIITIPPINNKIDGIFIATIQTKDYTDVNIIRQGVNLILIQKYIGENSEELKQNEIQLNPSVQKSLMQVLVAQLT